jgi:hypothetical protein
VGDVSCASSLPTAEPERPDQLHEVQERVYGGRTGLGPVREAVPTPAPIVGRHVDRFWRAAFYDVYVDALACQRTAFEDGGDRRSDLCVRGAHLLPVKHMRRLGHGLGAGRDAYVDRGAVAQTSDFEGGSPRSTMGYGKGSAVRPDSSQERGTGVSRPPVSTVVAEIASGREDPRRSSRADEALARRTQ